MESPQGPPNAGTRGRVSGPPPPWGVPPFSSAPWAWGRRGGRPGEGGPGAWGGGPVNLGFGAPATRGHGAAPGSPGEAGPRRSGLSVWKEDRLSDQRYSRDNSVVSPASPDQWGGSRPRCRLKVSWWCSRCQGCGCSPPKTLRCDQESTMRQCATPIDPNRSSLRRHASLVTRGYEARRTM